MLVKFVAALIIGTITACVGPFYYCKKFKEKCGKSDKCFNKSESFESESPLIHIKIMHPYRNDSTNNTTSNASDNTRNTADSKDIKETKQVVQDIQVSTEESQIVPYKTSHKRKRMQPKIWSSAMRGKLDRIKSSSSELCGISKVVRAHVEAPPLSSSNEASDIHGHYIHNSSRLNSSKSNLTDERVRKLSSVAVKKWKNLKRTLICSRSEKSMLQKEAEIDKKQRLTVPNHNSPYSATLKKNRLIDVSTSTRLSANMQNETTKKNLETSQPQKEVRRCSSAEALEEISSLLKNQSINGTSICDVKISGLTLNQADLMNLFQATNQSRTPSIIATEEASIISIKFHRENSSKNTSYYECPLRKIYRKLPDLFEDLSFSELLKSEEVEKSRRTPSIQLSKYSDRMNDSRNQTSYIDLPRFGNGLMTEEVFARQRTLSRRFNGR